MFENTELNTVKLWGLSWASQLVRLTIQFSWGNFILKQKQEVQTNTWPINLIIHWVAVICKSVQVHLEWINKSTEWKKCWQKMWNVLSAPIIFPLYKNYFYSWFLIQVTFYRLPAQVIVLPINKQAKQCPLVLNQAKTSPSMPGDTVTGHCVTDK